VTEEFEVLACGGLPALSQCREMIVCATWSNGNSSASAAGTVVTLVVRSAVLQSLLYTTVGARNNCTTVGKVRN
jgi:hypothetical protein